MEQKTINVTRSSMPEFEEYCEEIRDLWDSHFLTNMGILLCWLPVEHEDFLDLAFGFYCFKSQIIIMWWILPG